MKPIYTVATLREVERGAHTAPLMERAGAAAAGVARTILRVGNKRVLVLAGPGNNGGDGFVVARCLHTAGHDVHVVFCGDPSRLPQDARAACDAWLAAGGTTAAVWPDELRCDLIVDALFGIGLARAPGEPYATLIARANASGVPILALDIASGLDADRGTAFAPVIQATHTATFLALKPGLLTGDGPQLSGALSVHALAVDAGASAPPDAYVLDWESLCHRVPRRQASAHKGTHGTLGIVGGARGMTGAALLAGRAALNAGAGKVLVGFVDDAPAVDAVQPELMLRPARDIAHDGLTALAAGPGLGRSAASRAMLEQAIRAPVPLVLDADALNEIAADNALADAVAARPAPTLLTPHPAEAGRLLRLSTHEVQGDRVAAARALAKRFSGGIVLKGAGSICALSDGRWFINGSGNAGLASAGTGDVLTGLIAGLLAQGIAADDALLLGVCLHGAAADQLVRAGVGPIGLTASELIPAARRLLNA